MHLQKPSLIYYSFAGQCNSAREHAQPVAFPRVSRSRHHSPPGVQGGASGRHGAAQRERALPVGAGAALGRASARVGGRVRGLRHLQPDGAAAPRAAAHAAPPRSAVAPRAAGEAQT